MIYKAVEVIWIFSVGQVDRMGTKGTIRGPRRNKNIALVWSSNYVSSQKLPLDGAVHRTLLSTEYWDIFWLNSVVFWCNSWLVFNAEVLQRFFIQFLNFLKDLQKFCLKRLFVISQFALLIFHLHFDLALSVLYSALELHVGWMGWVGLGSLCGAIVWASLCDANNIVCIHILYYHK